MYFASLARTEGECGFLLDRCRVVIGGARGLFEDGEDAVGNAFGVQYDF